MVMLSPLLCQQKNRLSMQSSRKFSNCDGSICCERRRGKAPRGQSESLLRARKILERITISHRQPLDMSRDPLNTAWYRLEHYDTLESLYVRRI
jgi:hypothetical protein